MCSHKRFLTCSLLAAFLALFSLFFLLGNYSSSAASVAATAPSQPFLPYWQITCLDCPPSFLPWGDRFLQLDKTGTPHLVYTGEGNLYHSWRAPAGWQSEVITSTLDGIGNAAIAIDPQGELDIAYIANFPTGGALYLYTRTPSIASFQLLANFLGNEATVTSLAFDSSEYARIPFYDSAGKKLRYALETSSGWTIEEVDNGEYTGSPTSFVLDNQDYGHLSYSASKAGGGLRYAFQDISGWHTVEVDAAQVSPPTSLALDPDGKPHISYYNTSDHSLQHAYEDQDGSWQFELVAYAGQVTAQSSLAFDPDDTSEEGPCIAYGDIAAGRWAVSLKLACKHAGIWQIQTLDEHSGLVVAMLYNSSGEYQIAHYALESGELRWTIEDGASAESEVVAKSQWIGNQVDTETDTSGYAQIMYQRYVPTGIDPGQVRYAYQDSAGWHTIDVTNTLSNCEDMALDSQDNPHLSCIANNHLVYAHLDSGGWHTQTLASLGVSWGYSSIAVDDFDYTHISYDNPNHDNLEYAFIGEGSPVTETVNAYGGANLSLALSSADQPFISYANHAGGLELAYRDSVGWHILIPQPGQAARSGAPDAPTAVVKGTSLALDSSDQPRIAYVESDGTCSLHYLYASANQWSDELVDANPDGCAGLFPSLELDEAGYPHIAYYFEGDKDGDLKYAFKDVAGWHLQDIDSSGNVGGSSSLAISPDGKAWIAYLDSTHFDLKLAYTFPGYSVHLPFIAYDDITTMLP